MLLAQPQFIQFLLNIKQLKKIMLLSKNPCWECKSLLRWAAILNQTKSVDESKKSPQAVPKVSCTQIYNNEKKNKSDIMIFF